MKKLPEEVVSQWPEVLNDVDVYAIPVEYLHCINVSFSDDTTWQIDIDDSVRSSEDLESQLDDLFFEYDDVITKIDFKLDVKKLKQDVTKRTASFMKKRK